MVIPLLATSPWSRANWLVLAPHADDETLGAGALIAETASSGHLAAIVYLTDGAGSHPQTEARSAKRLTWIREREARRAVHRLGGKYAPSPIFLGWPDAHPPEPTDDLFRRSERRLSVVCRSRQIDAIAVTAQCEPHCDHEACFELARSACASAGRRIALFEYHVWSEEPRFARAVRTAPMAAGLRRHALQSHRSQLTGWLGDGFRLPPAKGRMRGYDRLFLWEKPCAAR